VTVWRAGVPTRLDAAGSRTWRRRAKKVPTLKKTLIGGSDCAAADDQGFAEQHGVTALQGWGMTETSRSAPCGTLRPRCSPASR